MKVLITGVAGFLGSRLAQWMLDNLKNPPEIYGVDNLSCGYRESVPSGVKFTEMTLGEGQIVGSELDRYYDRVFHFAAYAAEGLSPFCRQYNYRNNLEATAEVVNLCIRKRTRRLVFTSSMAVYGDGSNPPFRESAPLSPVDPYGVAKAACEADIRIAGQQHGLDWCILRPHNLYGPGQSIWQKYRNVLGNWMARYLANEPLLVYGSGLQRRAFSYVGDCLKPIWLAGNAKEASHRIINLGGSREVTIQLAASTVKNVLEADPILEPKEIGQKKPKARPVIIEHAPARSEVSQAWCTVEKSQRRLGYGDRGETQLVEGVREMWRWARAAWEEFPERRGVTGAPPIEITRGLYGYWSELRDGR